MNNFLALFIGAFLILFCFIAAVRYTTIVGEEWHPTVQFENRKIVNFEGANGEKIEHGGPVLVKGVIISESDSEVIMNVAYKVPPNSLVPYSLSIYPKSTGFKPQYVPLKEGVNLARVVIPFRPPSKVISVMNTKKLHVYINEHYGNGQKEVIYGRQILFHKRWKRPRKLVGPYIDSSRFGVSSPRGQEKALKRNY